MPDDAELQLMIETELMNDERLSSLPIRVSVDKGVVKLSGNVHSFRRRLIAHQIAAQYEGVADVENDLAVTPVASLPDEEVANHVRAALAANADVTQETIQVSVAGGKVSLSGTAGSHWERTVAEDATSAVSGVREVENLLMVDLATKVGDEELANSMKAALARARGLTDAVISVSVHDASVHLTGIVSQLWQKELAEDVVRRFGLMHLRNEIRVRGSGTSDAAGIVS